MTVQFFLKLCLVYVLTLSTVFAAEQGLVGSKNFIHIEKNNSTWWLVDAKGNRFVPTGMNHISPKTRFAPYNKEFWSKEFGADIFQGKGYNWQGAEVKKWMQRIVKDHKDFSFNTIAFHRAAGMPDEYYEELGIHYIGKLKFGEINHKHTRWTGGFPDVFSPEWRTKAEKIVQLETAKHKNNKHLIGYSFNDLPDYALETYLRRIKWQNKKDVFVIHPWINDIISKAGATKGKQIWVDILKGNYVSASTAGAAYGIKVSNWQELTKATQWFVPKNKKQSSLDQQAMNKKITEAWLKTHFELIRKYDPNHLILGDKISAHGKAQPDWVWDIVKKYVDVVLIQDFDFYDKAHENKLIGIHQKTGKPIINGDHSYGNLRPKMKKSKGVQVENLNQVGEQYAKYLQGIMGLPFMLGWQNCGYLEQWTGGQNDNTGKEQNGFFDPFGKPLMEALSHVKKANESAVQWHEINHD
jgi:hypothetical protein